MKLCIAEKPSVGKEIAGILGAKSRKDGYFEGNGYAVSWTFGHFCTLKAPEDYTERWKRWQLSMLPMIPPRFSIKLIDNDGVKKQFNVLKNLIEKADEVINCGDAGIEGELIQRWVLQKAQCKVPVKRLWISSLTEEAIRDGFANLKDASDYDKLYAAGAARAASDWLLGMNASRLYTLKFSNGKGVLSIGRVQTPTLALIVNRNREIENFVPQPFWELKTIYRDVTFSVAKGRFLEKEKALEALEAIKGTEFEITSVEKKKGKEQPPRLFDLTALQVECNKKFSFSADECLRLIQNLYERKLVTYPRVDTTYLPEDMYPKIEKILKGLKPYSQFTSSLIGKKIRKNKKVFDDKKITDHHAIIPTGVDPQGLTLDHKRVYDTIARRFIANFYPDCIVSNTTVMGEAGGHEFKATGKIILDEGWRVLYPRKNDGKPDDSQIMPEFKKGEKGEHQPDLFEKQTSPPKQYTEATLLRAMETAGKQVDDEELRELMKENGIGRPSTRANIIETLFRRKFIERNRKNLIPTITGIQLIDTIKNELLKSVELTGIWEGKLKKIEQGEFDAKLFMDEMKTMVQDLVRDVFREKHKSIVIKEDEDKTETKEKKGKTSEKKNESKEIACPKCKSGIILKGKSAYGCSGFKNGCDFRLSFTVFEKKLTEKQAEAILKKGKSTLIKGFVKDGEKVQAKVILNPETFLPELELTEKKEENTKDKYVCPKCGKGKIIKGKRAYGCSRYAEGCKYVVSFEEFEKKQ